jgi:hypothetical protein
MWRPTTLAGTRGARSTGGLRSTPGPNTGPQGQPTGRRAQAARRQRECYDIAIFVAARSCIGYRSCDVHTACMKSQARTVLLTGYAVRVFVFVCVCVCILESSQYRCLVCRPSYICVCAVLAPLRAHRRANYDISRAKTKVRYRADFYLMHMCTPI